MKEKCILYDRDCIDCGECEFCDLDADKLCDNCGKCLDMTDKGYATIKIEKIIYNGEEVDGNLYSQGFCEYEYTHSHDHCTDDDCDC